MRLTNSYFQSRVTRNGDLVLVLVVSILLLISVFFGQLDIIRMVLGIFFILVCPGYALFSALFPRGLGIDVLSTLVYSILLSVIMTALLGFVLDRTHIGVQVPTLLGGLLGFTSVALVIAFMRRGASEAFSLQNEIYPLLRHWIGSTPAQRLLVGLAVMFVVAVAGYSVAQPPKGEHITEFYLLGPGQTLDTVLDKWRAGRDNAVTVGVINRTNEPAKYEVEVLVFPVSDQQYLSEENRDELLRNSGLLLSPIFSRTLKLEIKPEQSLEKTLLLTPPTGSEYLLVTFTLTTRKTLSPLRELHLWIEVV